MKTLTSLTIKRSEWLTPDKWQDEEYKSLLLDSRGLKCCLGFACIELGYKAETLLEKEMPSDIIEESSQFTEISRVSEKKINSKLSDKAARINDDSHISNEKRETKLIELFRAYNITLNFVD